jgi:acyl-CoA thioesterase-1
LAVGAWKKWSPVSLALLAAACSPAAPDGGAAANAVSAGASNEAAPPALQAPRADARLVVAFGDSLFAGYQLDRGEGFAAVLERHLAAQAVAASVFDAGVSGDTTQAGRQRLAFVLEGLPRKPDLVIVGLGANDMLRGLRPDETRANLDAILTELRRRGIPAMLTGMVAAPNLGAAYAADFNPIYPRLAAQFGVPLYPVFLDGVIGQRELMLPDGKHPNGEGIETIVARVGPLVERALVQARRGPG